MRIDKTLSLKNWHTQYVLKTRKKFLKCKNLSKCENCTKNDKNLHNVKQLTYTTSEPSETLCLSWGQHFLEVGKNILGNKFLGAPKNVRFFGQNAWCQDFGNSKKNFGGGKVLVFNIFWGFSNGFPNRFLNKFQIHFLIDFRAGFQVDFQTDIRKDFLTDFYFFFFLILNGFP